MRNAVDFSYARPTGAELELRGLDALFYTGNARPSAEYINDLRSRGVAVTFIQETTSTRAQAGFGAGVADAQFADARASEVGYPTTAAIAYVVSDGSASDPNYGAENITAYAQGVASVSQRPFFFYGNRYCVDAAMAGGGARCLGAWVPSTWGSDPNRDLLIQEANIASPVGDTDLNSVYKPYGAWGQDSTTTKEDDDVANMYIAKHSDPNQGIWVTDGMYKRHVLPDEWSFAQFVTGGKAVAVPISDQWWDSLPIASPDVSLTLKDLVNVKAAIGAPSVTQPGTPAAPVKMKLTLTGEAVPE